MTKSKKTPKAKAPKRKLSAAQRKANRERKKRFMIMFINGKQKRVRRPEAMEGGLTVEEFLAQNADPIWLHQHEMWECMTPNEGRMEMTADEPPTETR